MIFFFFFRKQYRPTCYWSWKRETADIVENKKVNERMIVNELHSHHPPRDVALSRKADRAQSLIYDSVWPVTLRPLVFI